MTEKTATIEFTPEKLEDLKQAYRRAVRTADAGGADTFKFDGHEWFIEYAKYVIEYLEGQYADRPAKTN